MTVKNLFGIATLAAVIVAPLWALSLYIPTL